MEKEKVIYYQDEMNEDFANINRKEKFISDNYTYINTNPFWRALSFVAYRIIMTPIAYIYSKLKFNVKVRNRKVLKEAKGKGFYLYGNHTQVPGDGYIPTLLTFPVKPYVIVHPDSVAIKGTEQFMLMIGAMPLPSTIHGIHNFMKAVDKRIEQKSCVMIYPEAHIWPYYTKIRPFQSVSFKYPVKTKAPSFCFTTMYKKRKYSKKPRIIVYVDGPFYVDETLNRKQQQEGLRNRIYNTMLERTKESDCEYIKYIKRDDQL